MQGNIIDFDEPLLKLRNVMITKKNFSCEYTDAESHRTYRIETTSSDGLNYSGAWGERDDGTGDIKWKKANTVTLTRFDNANETALIGIYNAPEYDPQKGRYQIRLHQ